MTSTSLRRALAVAAALALGVLHGCGGGGGSDPAPTVPPNNPPPTSPPAATVSYGGITAFGSVWVNGVEYSTSNASFRRDGRDATEAELRVGMVVRVEGSIRDKAAARLTVDGALKGRVEQVVDANRLRVMGQEVQIDANTRFENNTQPALGDWVEVHGLVVGDGAVAAGFVERQSPPTPLLYAVKGIVKNHDTAANTLAIGSLTVQLAGATVRDLPAGNWNGRLVEIKGSACTGNPVCGTLTATAVEPSGARFGDNVGVEIEGYVSATSATGFTLAGQAVSTSSSTVYENGTVDEISIGTKLEVEGTLSNGVLQATKVSFRDSVRLEADVASVANGTITLVGLPGVTVQTNALTRLKGNVALGDIAAPNHLRIRGRLAPSGAVLASEIERRSATSDSRVILQAALTAVAAPNLSLLGLTVDTTAIADAEFKDAKDLSIGRSAFFAAVKVGSVVKLRADLRNGSLRWDQAEIEN